MNSILKNFDKSLSCAHAVLGSPFKSSLMKSSSQPAEALIKLGNNEDIISGESRAAKSLVPAHTAGAQGALSHTGSGKAQGVSVCTSAGPGQQP